MRALLQGAMAGYGIAVPVGPIAVLIVERGLRRGFRQSFAAGLGAATADLAYATLAALVGVVAAELLAPLAGPLKVVAALGLLGFAVKGLWSLHRARRVPPTHADAAPVDVDDASAHRTFAAIFGLTLLNPITVAYFAALVLGGVVVGSDLVSRALFVVGAFAASLSWQTLLAAIGAVGGRRLPAGAQAATAVAGNVVIIGLAVKMFTT